MGIHESGEDYLEAILMLGQSKGFVRAVDIAARMGVSKASVSKALVNLTQTGHVNVIERDVRLTGKGRSLAESVLERHVFFFDLLVLAGVDPETASDEACRMEHCLSDESFHKLRRALRPVVSRGSSEVARL